MGNFKRIWSEGQATRIHKVTVQREQGLCKCGGEFDKRICGRTGSKTRVPLIPGPWLFTVFLGRVVRKAMVGFQGEVELDSCLIQILMFTDDTVIIAQKKEDLSWNVGSFHEAVKRHAT